MLPPPAAEPKLLILVINGSFKKKSTPQQETNTVVVPQVWKMQHLVPKDLRVVKHDEKKSKHHLQLISPQSIAVLHALIKLEKKKRDGNTHAITGLSLRKKDKDPTRLILIVLLYRTPVDLAREKWLRFQIG